MDDKREDCKNKKPRQMKTEGEKSKYDPTSEQRYNMI